MTFSATHKNQHVSAMWKAASVLCKAVKAVAIVAAAAAVLGTLAHITSPSLQPALHIRDINYDRNQGAGKCDKYIGSDRKHIQLPQRDIVQLFAVDKAVIFNGERAATRQELQRACSYDPLVHGTSRAPGPYSNAIVANQPNSPQPN